VEDDEDMRSDESMNPEVRGRTASDRRNFLKFLAASPCIAALGGVAAFLEQGGIDAQEATYPQPELTFPQPWELASPAWEYAKPITDPAQALDVFDFEEPMHRKLLPGHWAHYVTGVDSEATLHANREGFNHVYLRPRRLRDMAKLNTKATIFGTTYDAPIFTCPTGGQRSIWLPDGELSVSRAAKARNTMQMLDSGASESVEDCCAALGRPVVQQIYAPAAYSNTQILMKRLVAAGVTTIVLTIDVATGRNTEVEERLRQQMDVKTCSACHEGVQGNAHIMDKGFDNSRDAARSPLDWIYVDKMRQDWKGKFGIKGILTREDAALCIKHGIDFVHVSNHSGRATETFRSTIETLPEIVAEVNGKVPVFIDSGFRRGTDVFKALALGATAVGIGRPMLWGLGAFGQPGVDKVLDIMQRELRLVMGNCGTASLAEITRDYVMTPDWKS
jgi:isopentenyl diphosphate isomerase/L-lactate dehydrogenase-like FMN-dependent dehydrogenase